MHALAGGTLGTAGPAEYRVENMGSMFSAATAFNQPIGGWDTRNVTDMRFMFAGAAAFNQPIGRWVTGNVTDMQLMFCRAHAFDQRLDFETRAVRQMSGMFDGARAFNNGSAPLVFDTTNVQTTSRMFRFATSFMQEARFTDMGAVEDVQGMFRACGHLATCVTSRVNHGALGYADEAARFRFVRGPAAQ